MTKALSVILASTDGININIDERFFLFYYFIECFLLLFLYFLLNNLFFFVFWFIYRSSMLRGNTVSLNKQFISMQKIVFSNLNRDLLCSNFLWNKREMMLPKFGLYGMEVHDKCLCENNECLSIVYYTMDIII